MMRTKVAALIAAVAVAAVACTSAGEVGDSGHPAGGPPVPKGAAEVSDLPAPDEKDECNAQASLRPDGPPPPPRQFEPGTAMADIVARGKLTVGVDQNTYQFGYRDPESGDLQGFDIDMARQIAAALLGDPNAIQFKVLTSADRIPAVTSGEVDIVVQTMTINCERREQVDFSSVYYMAGQRVLVKKDAEANSIEELGGKKVCAANGSTSIARIVNVEVDPRPVGIGVAGWTDCLVMLQQNQVDAISTDDTILAGLKAQDPFTKIIGNRFSEEPYGMAISKESPELTRFVNAVLEQLRSNGEWTRIYDRWLFPLLEQRASPPQAKYTS
jgi:polar amino acid transport system substrate-binding protein